MITTNEPTRVVAICEAGPVRQQITTTLSSMEEFILADILDSGEKLVREIRAAEAGIILIDHQLGNEPTLDIIDDLILQFPTVALVAILPSEDPLMAQQVMLAGARAFIIQPFTQINLLSTLRRVRDLELRRMQSQATSQSSAMDAMRPLRTLTIFSPRGGVGCTTLAANLAMSLAEETNQRVLLFEGKMFFGHLDVMLNIRTQNTVADLIPHARSLDENLINDVVNQHVGGFHVLLSPSNVQVAQGIRPDDLYSVIIGLQRAYDLVVIDAGSTLTENTVTLLDAADRILLVANPDLASLHDITRFIQVSRSLAYSPEKLLVVLNRSNMPGGVKIRDIETVLHYQLFAQIPDDAANAIRSLNRGLPLVFRYPRSPATRAIKHLAKSLADMSLAEPVAGVTEAGGERTRRDALLASSQFG